jgi:hypothetical protein
LWLNLVEEFRKRTRTLARSCRIVHSHSDGRASSRQGQVAKNWRKDQGNLKKGTCWVCHKEGSDHIYYFRCSKAVHCSNGFRLPMRIVTRYQAVCWPVLSLLPRNTNMHSVAAFIEPYLSQIENCSHCGDPTGSNWRWIWGQTEHFSHETLVTEKTAQWTDWTRVKSL